MPEILFSTRNNERTRKRVERAARRAFGTRHRREVFYEHGQWWVIVHDTRPDEEFVTYSVVDASGPGSIDGFGFEEV